jgi:alkaline phosphatase isozyme conversion protein
MRRTHRILLVLFVAALLLMLVPAVALAGKAPAGPMGTEALYYLKHLAVEARVAGTPAELSAAFKIKGWFASEGYSARLQRFSFDDGGTTAYSQNVIAYRRASVRSTTGPTPLVIVGAHYDCVDAGLGADDNASGVGVLLELAQRIASYHQDYDLVFVAFGSEELGELGSNYYVEHLPAADIARCIAMVNFDSLIAGDRMYAHAGFNQKTWARDRILNIAHKLHQPIVEQPGLNPEYPKGLTPDGFSDYTAFNDAGIPIVAFEATNWSIGDYDGWIQTVKYGSFWHTPNDRLAIIQADFPGRPMAHLRAYTTVVFAFLKGL